MAWRDGRYRLMREARSLHSRAVAAHCTPLFCQQSDDREAGQWRWSISRQGLSKINYSGDLIRGLVYHSDLSCQAAEICRQCSFARPFASVTAAIGSAYSSENFHVSRSYSPSVEAIMFFWISDVPPPMVASRESRKNRCMGYSMA